MSTQTVITNEAKEASVTAQKASHCLPKDLHVSAHECYAGLWRRFAAVLIDLVILYTIAIALGIVLVVLPVVYLTSVTDGTIDVIVYLFGQLFGLIGAWLYFSLFESSQKQATPGKLALHIKVVGPDGSRISFGRATGRHFAKILSYLTLGVGYIMAGFTAKKQALHDMVANCFVIKQYRVEIAHSEETNSGAVAHGQMTGTDKEQMKWLVLTLLVFILIGIIVVRFSNTPAATQAGTEYTISTQPDVEIMAEELSHALEGISKENITKELIEKFNDVPTKYTSLSDGFAVYFPSTPQKNAIKDVMGSSLKNYQSVRQDGFVQYNVFFHYFDKKILSDESQEAYLGSHLAGSLLFSKNSRVITNNQFIFRGFNARNYEYIEIVEGIEISHEGIIFFIDGDSVFLTCVYPKAVDPQPSFDEFVKSFELLPLEARLSDEFWKDLSTGLMFRPPIDMHEREKKSRKSIIVTFVNKAGHSISIINVTAEYPSFKLSDIRKEFPQATRDSEGFLVNTIHNSTLNMDFIQLVKLLEHENNIFMLQGYAPKQTFFRSERIFKESINTVTFVN